MQFMTQMSNVINYFFILLASVSRTNEKPEEQIKLIQIFQVIFHRRCQFRASQLTHAPSSSERPRETLARPHSTAFSPPPSEDEARERSPAPVCRLLVAPEMPRYCFNCPITRNVAATTPAPPPRIHARLFISQSPARPRPHPAGTNSQFVAVGPPPSAPSCLSFPPVN